MATIPQPKLIDIPFANSGLKTSNLPNNDDTGVGNASWEKGFPEETMRLIADGGVPPHGQDMNGILNQICLILQYLQSGTLFKYNSSFATAIGGYPKGALVLSTDKVTLWRSTVDGNTTNPDAGGAGWVNFLADLGLYLPLAGGTMTGRITSTNASVPIDFTNIPSGAYRDIQAVRSDTTKRIGVLRFNAIDNANQVIVGASDAMDSAPSGVTVTRQLGDGTTAGTITVTVATTPATTAKDKQIATTEYVKNCLPKSIGSATKLTYTNGDGVLTESNATVGAKNKPIWMNSGTLTAFSETIGGAAKPMYMNAGVLTAFSSTIGSTTKPIYVNAGTLTESNATVGSASKPMYLNAGVLTQCSSSLTDYLPLAGGDMDDGAVINLRENTFSLDDIDTSSKEFTYQTYRLKRGTTYDGGAMAIHVDKVANTQTLNVGFRVANPRAGHNPSAGTDDSVAINTGNCWDKLGLRYYFDINRAYPYSSTTPALKGASTKYYSGNHLVTHANLEHFLTRDGNENYPLSAAIPVVTTVLAKRTINNSFLSVRGGNDWDSGGNIDLYGKDSTSTYTLNGDTFPLAGSAQLASVSGNVRLLLNNSDTNKNGIARVLSNRPIVVDGNINASFIYNDTALTYNATPSSNISRLLARYNDTNGQRVGAITVTNYTNGSNDISLNIIKHGTTDSYSILRCGFNSDGVAYAQAPSTSSSPSNTDIITYDYLKANPLQYSVNGQLNTVSDNKVWFKVASVTCNGGYWTRTAALLVQEVTSINVAKIGILELRLRAEANATSINTSNTSLRWLSNAGIPTGDIALVYYTSGSNTVFELWCKCVNAYQAYKFTVLSTSDGQTSYPFLTFYNGRSSNGSTALPSGTVVYSDDSYSDLNKSGGTMTGTIVSSIQNIIKRSVDDSILLILGGTSNTAGSRLELYGSSRSTNPGAFLLTTGTVSNAYCQLLAKPDGTLTWSGAVPAASTDSTQIATTAYVKDCLPKSIGSATKLTYTNSNGVLTASDSTVGDANTPVYLSNGVITSTGKSFANYLPLSGGTMTGNITKKSNLTKGTNPSSTTWHTDLLTLDNGGTATANRLFEIRGGVDSNGFNHTDILAYDFTSGSTAANVLLVGKLLNGVYRTEINNGYFRIENEKIMRNSTDGWMRLTGGSTDNTGGGSLLLYGKEASSHQGQVILQAHNGTNSTNLSLQAASQAILSTGLKVAGGNNAFENTGLTVSGTNTNYSVKLQSTGFTKGTSNATNYHGTVEFYGNTMTKWQDRAGLLEFSVVSNKSTAQLVAYNVTAAENTNTCAIGATVDASGNAATFAPTPAAGDNSTKIATTAWVTTAVTKGANMPPGTIVEYAGTSAPSGWLYCNGAAVSRTTYAALFSAIGTGYGTGNGSSTFNLPDFRNRVPQGGSSATDRGNIAAGLPNITGTVHGGKGTTASGAFTLGDGNVNSGEGNKTQGHWFSFDANDGATAWNANSSGIYGNSTTVQPPAVKVMFIIKT